MVSSAYISMSEMHSLSACHYIRNNKGPRIEACGTSVVINFVTDIIVFNILISVGQIADEKFILTACDFIITQFV